MAVCPVDCIRPTPDDPEFATAEMLYIEPQSCIDCGACIDECPVDAIVHLDDLDPSEASFAAINADYFDLNPLDSRLVVPEPRVKRKFREPLRVAIVGAGPAGLFAADTLLEKCGEGVEIDLLDRAQMPGGLLRAGVAPDHLRTKRIGDRFDEVLRNDQVRLLFNVDVGKDLTHDELTESHHAVIYATGAHADRPISTIGARLDGVHTAGDLVRWYNGDPDKADEVFRFDTERAVVVGNGNVALDVARILLTDPDTLATTDMSAVALEALTQSKVREVLVLGRRGSLDAAFTLPELVGLADVDGVDLLVDRDDFLADAADRGDDGGLPYEKQAKDRILRGLSAQPASPTRRRIVLRFNVAVSGLEGIGRVERAHLHRTGSGPFNGCDLGPVGAGLIVFATGSVATPVTDLPFDDHHAIIPNQAGRVMSAAHPVPGTFVTGWAKRGAQGGIGANKGCAQETVSALLADAEGGHFRPPTVDRRAFHAMIVQRQPQVVARDGWERIDAWERHAGRTVGAPRRKLLTREELLAVATNQ